MVDYSSLLGKTKTNQTIPLISETGDIDVSALLDPNAYSTSKSQSLSGGTSQSSNSSQSSGTNFSGLDAGTRGKITESVLPGLTESAGKLSSVPSEYSEAANNLYRKQTRSAMEELYPQIMESMSSGNMQNSSVASDSLAKGMSELSKTYGEKGYQSKMDEAEMEMALPQIYAALANLAQYSEGTSSSSSSGGSTSKNSSVSESLNENAGEPYDRGIEILRQLLNV